MFLALREMGKKIVCCNMVWNLISQQLLHQKVLKSSLWETNLWEVTKGEKKRALYYMDLNLIKRRVCFRLSVKLIGRSANNTQTIFS